MKRIKPSIAFPVAWLIISTLLLTIPGKAIPQENWLGKIWFDKWVHIGMFGIMIFLWCWAIQRIVSDKTKLKNIFVFIALLCLAYGIGMEFVQKYLVNNRSFDTGDIIADAVGCVTGLIFSIRYIKN